MPQVEVCYSTSSSSLQIRINDFLRSEKMSELIDIKFAKDGESFIALIIYEE